MSNKVVNEDTTTQRESISELLEKLAKNSAVVVHDEIELVIQGAREKMRAVRIGVLTIATAAVIGLAAFFSICAALIIGLTSYMDPVIAAFVTGAALGLISVVTAFIGYKQLKKAILKT